MVDVVFLARSGLGVYGGDMVADLRRIMICIPNSLLQEIDSIIVTEKLSRSQVVREAICLYSAECKRKAARSMMTKGYQEMSIINLTLAEEGFASDAEAYDMLPDLLVESNWKWS